MLFGGDIVWCLVWLVPRGALTRFLLSGTACSRLHPPCSSPVGVSARLVVYERSCPKVPPHPRPTPGTRPTAVPTPLFAATVTPRASITSRAHMVRVPPG